MDFYISRTNPLVYNKSKPKLLTKGHVHGSDLLLIVIRHEIDVFRLISYNPVPSVLLEVFDNVSLDICLECLR